jgi:glycosyl transferase, family 25
MANNQEYIDLLNDYYDKIYLVIIERNIPERLNKIELALKGLNYTIFKGVDGRLLSEQEKTEIYDHVNSSKYMDEYFQFRYHQSDLSGLNIGNIGCSKSHLNIYNEMLQKGYKRILILEDDARFDYKQIHLIPQIFQEMPNDAELFYWGYRWYDCESFLSRLKRKYFIPIQFFLLGKNVKQSVLENNIKYPKKYKKNIWYSGFHAGTHAYAITNETAKKLIELNDPVVFAADSALSYLVKNKLIKAYIAVPMIFREDQSLISSIFYSEYKG